jgi:hypothetical protein
MLKFGLLSLIISLGIVLISCNEDNPADTGANGVVKDISDSLGGNLEKEGYEIQVPAGAIPPRQDGSRATVSFSIELGVQSPGALPQGGQLVGRMAYFAPDGFVFNFPLRLFFPIADEDPFDLFIMNFDYEENTWVVVPTSAYDSVNKRIGVDVVELGIYAVVKRTTTGVSGTKNPSVLRGYDYGGVTVKKVFHPQSEYSVVTVKSAVYSRQSDENWWGSASRLIGRTGRTWWFVGGGQPWRVLPMYWSLPLGTYEFWVSRVFPDGRWETYTMPVTVNITSPLIDNPPNFPGGWYEINESSLSGGDWSAGRPGEIKPATTSVGTGQLQITLKWVNTESSYADLDLHLVLPDQSEVYFGNKISEGGELALDKDWMTSYGNAIENIYSLKTMPKGSYKIYVDHFSGYTKTFSVRVKRGTYIRTYNHTIESGEQINIENFSM